MADEKQKKGAGDQPPKMRLKTSADTGGLPKADVPNKAKKPAGDEDGAPPKMSLPKAKPAEEEARIDLSTAVGDSVPSAKRETARIDLGSAKPDGDEKESTVRIDTEPAEKDKEDTARIDEGSAEKDKEDTARIDTESAEDDKEGTARIDTELAEDEKESTARIDTAPAKPDEDDNESTARIDTAPAKPDEDDNESTARIELKPPPPDVAKRQTARIDLSDVAPAGAKRRETARIDLPVDPSAETVVAPLERTERMDLKRDKEKDAPAEPEGTARIELDVDPETEDVFRRHVSASAAPGVAKSARPRTVKIRRPAPPGGGEAGAAKPAGEEAAGKRHTARIDLPADATTPAAGRPKTIKIKRAEMPPPDPTIGAPTKGKPGSAAKPAVQSVVTAPQAETIGALHSVLALITVLVLGVLVYALLAQTFVPSLPFPGRIGL